MDKKNIIYAAGLACCTALFYFPSLYYSFQFDDLANIVKFYDIRHKTLAELFFKNTRWISYWLNTQFYKMAQFNPFYYRVGNVCFHIITGLMLFSLFWYALSRLKKDSFFKKNASYIAFCTAAFFLLHPVQTQTVSYVIQGQLEGLAGLFITALMLCISFFVYASSTLKKICLYSLFVLLCILACGTKEIVIIAPALLLIFDWFLLAQGSLTQLRQRWYFHATAWVVIGSIYVYFLKPEYFLKVFGLAIEAHNNIGNVLTENPQDKITSVWYFISQFQVLLHYFTIFFWPFNISVDYDWLLVRGFLAPECLFPFLALCCIAFSIYKILRKDKAHLIGFGLIWFFVTLLPRSTIIPSTELVADYKTYTASIGLLFVFACGMVYFSQLLFEFMQKHALLKKLRSPQAALLAQVLLIVPLGLSTLYRNYVWRSAEEFWSNIILNAPNKARAYNNYGVALSEKQRFKESIWYYKKAITMDSNYPDPCNNLAVAYSAVGDLDQAIVAMQHGIRIQPYYPEGYNNLASFLIQKKSYERAEKALKTAVQLRPHYGKAHFNLGRLYMELNRAEEAFESFKKCCTQADFDNDIGFAAYGAVSLELNKIPDAIAAYSRLAQIKPGDYDAQFNLGNAYYLNKNFDKAETIFFALHKLRPQDTKVGFNLAETYYSQNKLNKALEIFEEVAKLNNNLPQIHLRIAACHAKSGRLQDAQQELLEMLNKPTLPENLKKTAKLALNEVSALLAKKTRA